MYNTIKLIESPISTRPLTTFLSLIVSVNKSLINRVSIVDVGIYSIDAHSGKVPIIATSVFCDLLDFSCMLRCSQR